MDGRLIVVLIAAVVIGLVVAARIPVVLRLRRMASWPAVQGRVITREEALAVSEPGHGPADQRPQRPHNLGQFAYAYEVGGRNYLGNRIRPDHDRPPGADARAAAYPTGQAIRVLHDPDDPAQSVLEFEPADTYVRRILMVAGILLSILAIIAASIEQVHDLAAPLLPAGGRAPLFLTFAIMGLVTLFLSRVARIETAWPRRWAATEGTIRASEVTSLRRKASLWHQPRVAYDYRVDGEDFVGDRIGSTIGPVRSTSKRAAQKVVDGYPAGLRVTVFYDPGNPSRSCLRRQPAVHQGLRVIAVLLLAAAAWAAFD